MSIQIRAALSAGAAAIALAACSQSASSPIGNSSLPGTQSFSMAQTGTSYHAACADDRRPHYMHCLALVRDDINGVGVDITGVPKGLEPSQFQAAYNIDTTGGAGQVIALVDAYDNPNAASDLAVYRSEWGLPACGAGCFTKYNQEGQTSNYPSGNEGWGVEEDLDIEMASATCPNCSIILVEANSANNSDLGAAVTEAVKLGATVVSNSYQGSEYRNEDQNTPYNQPVPVLASAGDGGYGTGYPSASQYVISVGGTTLTSGGGGLRGWTETVWNGTGSGCTEYAAKPSWQTDPSCSNRMMNDISWDANPNTGPAEYDTYGEGGWFTVGGTSVSSPAVAGEIGAASANGLTNAGYIYANVAYRTYGVVHGNTPGAHKNSETVTMTDIISGSNGSCTTAYFCHAEKGYDGPTGEGTPYGMDAL